ncbi:beta-propeller fold lactonase family protein [Bacillus sp. SH5-2]|uniref:beta-propeller fold lactonase family protein n=1 Tax=Bacillus sp. SH5-2 TaxID=2217834 RepID=UPI002106B349|nr:beta-propeller fold lactonase family protein [Bacillus sp. SH5-2]
MTITDNILYVSNALGNNIAIYNISNPTAPVRIGEFNGANLNGPSGLDIIGNILYVANTGDNTVEIYNISTPTDPVRVGEFGATDLNVPNGLAVFTLFG